MAQQVKVNLTTVGVAAGALGACISLGAAGFAGLDWYIVHVIDREQREQALAELCNRELTGEEEKDQYLLDARAALGGC